MNDHSSIIHHGTRVPDWAPEDADTPETYAASNGTDSATMNARSDELGYCIETWNEGVGITTYWTKTDRAAGEAFVDAYATDDCQHDNGACWYGPDFWVCDMCSATVEAHA